MNINSRILICGWLFVMGSVSFGVYGKKDSTVKDPWVGWHRPVDANVFTSTKGNNHDSVLFVEPELDYPYHLIISHTPQYAHLWRSKKFSWSSADWELVTDQYKIGNFL